MWRRCSHSWGGLGGSTWEDANGAPEAPNGRGSSTSHCRLGGRSWSPAAFPKRPKRTKKWHDSARKWAQNRQHLRQSMGPVIGCSSAARRPRRRREDFPRPKVSPFSHRGPRPRPPLPAKTRRGRGGVCSFSGDLRIREGDRNLEISPDRPQTPGREGGREGGRREKERQGGRQPGTWGKRVRVNIPTEMGWTDGLAKWRN